MLQFLGKRMREVLIDRTNDEGYERLSDEDRKAVSEILRETKSEFWNEYVAVG